MSAQWAIAAALCAGTLLVIMSVADPAALKVMAPGVLNRIGPGLLINAGAATVAWLEGAITPSGAAAGVAIGITIYAGAGWEGWIVLAATFAAAQAASHAGWRRKHALGIAQEQEGRRGAAHVLANCGVAAAASAAAMVSPYQTWAWLALVAALAAAGADTVASEIGKAWGRRTFLIVNLRPVPPGTPGAVSLEGTIANIAAALAFAGCGAALGLIAPRAVPFVALAAVASAALESVLAATLERRGILNNHLLNYMNTAAAVGIAVYLI